MRVQNRTIAQKINKRKGISIIEILIALAIFSIAILGIGKLTFQAVKFSRVNELKEKAIYKAEKLLNYLVSLNYTDSCLDNSTEKECCQNGICSNETCCRGLICTDENFTIRYSVNEADTDIKKISVKVEFRIGNQTYEVSLEQLKGNWR